MDYREYLHDYYEIKKEQFKGFSYRIFSDKIGFKTKDFILRVIQGKRNLGTASLKNAAKLANFCGESRKTDLGDFFCRHSAFCTTAMPCFLNTLPKHKSLLQIISVNTVQGDII
ncbi:MAG TPA: TIGR02147 family protein [Fibrobacter sp.]|nr:TIGR02147 family protein [Fibrobacter sp.]